MNSLSHCFESSNFGQIRPKLSVMIPNIWAEKSVKMRHTQLKSVENASYIHVAALASHTGDR